VDQAIENIDLTPVPVAQTDSVTTVNVDPASVLAADPAVRVALDRAVAAVDTSVATRAAVRQAEKAVEISKQQYRATRAQRLPSIGLVTNYQRLAYPTNGLPSSIGDFFPNWTAGVQLSFPFFTGGRVRGEELAAQAGIVEAEQRLRQVQEGAALDVQQAVAQLEEAISAWQASQGTADQATRAYSIAEVRFREGISTQLELSETRVQLQQAQANRARAARDLQVARVRLQLIRDLPIGAGAGFGGAMGGSAGSAGGGAAVPAGQQQGTQRSGTNMQSGNLP
jgi:outer membrane protein TolC